MKFRELGGRPLGGRNLPGPYISATSRTSLGGASTPAPPAGTTGQPIGLLLILTKAS
jgi:hypothetical protein